MHETYIIIDIEKPANLLKSSENYVMIDYENSTIYSSIDSNIGQIVDIDSNATAIANHSHINSKIVNILPASLVIMAAFGITLFVNRK